MFSIPATLIESSSTSDSAKLRRHSSGYYSRVFRRGWLIVMQVILVLACMMLSCVHPVARFNHTFIITLVISIASAT